jgi:hypothetical protein
MAEEVQVDGRNGGSEEHGAARAALGEGRKALPFFIGPVLISTQAEKPLHISILIMP